MIVGLIPIYKEDYFEFKIEIYYPTLKIIRKNMFKSLFWYMIIWQGTKLEKLVVQIVLIICMDRNV